ncbi:MAG: OmpH family outer membrane protein [Alphaproteobacteria bacterium]|nr:OmpH family outer membrane protein [Alphaproteobacteria bacterium]
MRLLAVLSILLIAVPITALKGGGVRAEEMPAAVVAVLDYERILRASDAAKDVRRQIQQYRTALRDEVQAEEIALRQEETDLKRQRSVLSPEAFAEKREQFKTRVIAAQRKGQGHKQHLDRAYKAAMERVQRAVIPIVKKLTEEKGYTIVVDKSQVLFAYTSLDISQAVMLELNKSLRTVAVQKPQ